MGGWGEEEVGDGDEGEGDLEEEQFETELAFVGGAEEAEGQVEEVHVGGDGVEGVGLGVVGGESVAGAGDVAEELGDGVEEIQ